MYLFINPKSFLIMIIKPLFITRLYYIYTNIYNILYQYIECHVSMYPNTHIEIIPNPSLINNNLSRFLLFNRYNQIYITYIFIYFPLNLSQPKKTKIVMIYLPFEKSEVPMIFLLLADSFLINIAAPVSLLKSPH